MSAKRNSTATRQARDSDPVLRAARTLFLEAGYDGVNLQRVATRAGVSRQTLYNRFGSKEAVFEAMLEQHWAAFADGMQISAETKATSASKALRQVAERILGFIDATDQIAFTRLVVAEASRRPWIAETFYRVGKAPLLRSFVALLRQLEDAGAIDCPDPALAARQFLGLIQEFVIWPQVMAIGPPLKDLPPRDRVVDEAIATFLARYGR